MDPKSVSLESGMNMFLDHLITSNGWIMMNTCYIWEMMRMITNAISVESCTDHVIVKRIDEIIRINLRVIVITILMMINILI